MSYCLPACLSSPKLTAFFKDVKETKKTDVALITGCVALLIIGIAASCGAFNFIGTTNAAYLSYGMYAGAALCLLTEVGKVASHYCPKSSSHPKKFDSHLPDEDEYPFVNSIDPLNEGNLAYLKGEAKKFADTAGELSEDLYSYLIQIINDQKFQKDPQAYLQELKLKRDDIEEERRAIEDPARKLLFSLLNKIYKA